MKAKFFFAGLSMAILSFQATGWAQSSGSYRQTAAHGQINWTEQYIEATGSGIAPSQGNAGQQKLMARRAAVADAYRQLAEVVEGVQVTAETTVRNYVTESDLIRTRVQAVLKGAQPVGEPRLTADGAVEMTVRMPLYGAFASAIGLDQVISRQQKSSWRPQAIQLASLDLSGLSFELARCQRTDAPEEAVEPENTDLAPEENPDPGEVVEPAEPQTEPIEPEEPAESAAEGLRADNPDQAFTGLVIDARGMGLSPSMSPRVRAEANQVYVGNFPLDIDRVIAEGIILYYGSLEDALGSQRVGNHPLVVKPVGTDKHHVDFVVSDQDARQIQSFDQRDHFLQKLQVVAVLD